MSNFTEAIVENDADVIAQEMRDAVAAALEGWFASPGDLDGWILEIGARVNAQTRTQAATSTAAMFKQFGEKIASVPPILAAPATVASTWTMIDTAGHTIEAGTEVKILVPGQEPAGFIVVSDVVVAPGSSVTAAGEVTLQAVIPGEAANGLTEDASLITSYSFVDEPGAIPLVGESSGGVDEEDEDAYLDRLVEELQTLSTSLIVQRDFEIDARAEAGVARALCIPAWNGEKAAAEALAVTLVGVDAAGIKLSTPVKEGLQARQAAKIPSGVLNFVVDPTTTKVDVETKVVAMPGNDPVAVKAAVEAALSSYLSPANWGRPSVGDAATSAGWVNAKTVYLNELISEVDRVPGVARVVSLKLAKDGNTLEAKDLALTGLAPLTQPDTLTVTVE